MSNNRPYVPNSIATLLGGGIAWAIGLVVVLTVDDPRLRFQTYALGMALSGLGWLALMREAGRLRSPAPARAALIASVVAGSVARLAALGFSPAFSEDVFRYVYEGRVVWHYGWTFPFLTAPADAPALGVDPGLLDHAWLRINHPELSTIYPPLAQLVFVAAAGVGTIVGGSHLLALKLLLVAADIATWRLVVLALRARGRPAVESIAWGLSPLVILEVAREGHADSLSALGLAIGIYGFTAARPRVGYLGWALAALAKLNGLVAMVAAARSTRRGLGAALLLVSVLVVPYAIAGGSSSAGLAAYASRWRAGDGAFTLMLELSGAALGGEWARLEGFGPFGALTVTRHQLARLLAAAAFAAWTLIVVARPAPMTRVAGRAGLLLTGLLLLSPTLHPWYVLWLLPFAAAADFAGRRAVLALALLAPALHHPGWLELIDGRWRDLGWVRAVVHLPVWALLITDLARARTTR